MPICIQLLQLVLRLLLHNAVLHVAHCSVMCIGCDHCYDDDDYYFNNGGEGSCREA